MLRLLALLLTTAMAAADEIPLKIERPWIIAVPPTASATAAFMILKNTGDKALKIVSIKTAIAAQAEPMIGTKSMVNGQAVSGMESVAALEIPAHGRRTLEPGGDHLMLMDLKAHPKVGETVTLLLRIEPGGVTREIKVPVALTEPKN